MPTEITRAPDKEVARTIAALPTLNMPRHHLLDAANIRPAQLQKVLVQTYENPPEDFQAELIYGRPAATRDPAAYAFAHGGKDGTPYPVHRERYDQTIETFETALRRARLGQRDRLEALKRLGQWAAMVSDSASSRP